MPDGKQPTDAQNASYLRCLQIDARRHAERNAGRSGYLSDELVAEERQHESVVVRAWEDGVIFDRMAFGEVEPA